MKWSDQMGNQFRLTYRPWSVNVMKFDGAYWVEDGTDEGVLVEMKTWLGDKWFVRPDELLFTRHQIEARDNSMSDLMKSKVETVKCDCGCELSKPANEWSSAWNQAAGLVRCTPMPNQKEPQQ